MSQESRGLNCKQDELRAGTSKQKKAILSETLNPFAFVTPEGLVQLLSAWPMGSGDQSG